MVSPILPNMAEPKIISADLSIHGVMIVFDDGKTALFPAPILYKLLAQISGVIDGPGPEELEEE